MTFPDRLKALRERATQGNSPLTSNVILMCFLANHAEAIERVVRAAENVKWASDEIKDALAELEKEAG